MYNIRVPATTANLGAGFDSIGLAFKLYNHLSVSAEERGLYIEIANPGAYIPETDERNLIYRTYRAFFDELGIAAPGGLRMKQRDYIPPTSGLGSSAACIVAGLTAANAISGAGLNKRELAVLAARMEGHPDNSTAAIFGGLTVGSLTDGELDFVKLNAPVLNELAFAVILPGFTLPTAQSRGVLPERYTRADAVFNLSRAGLTVAAFANGDLDMLGRAIDDRLHQPYRLPLVPEMDMVINACKNAGALAAFLSGAGPALIAVIKNETADAFSDALMRDIKARASNNWTVKVLEADPEGVLVQEA